MSSNADSRTGQNEVVLRDLQSLLVKAIGQDVQVLDFTTTPLIPKGENFASTMMKVEASIKRSKDSPEEKLHLVAKMMPETDFQRSLFDCSILFSKEIYVMESLAPIYKQLERDVGVSEGEVINIFPQIYGGRLSRNERSNVADEDAVMLLENLNVCGFDTMNRMTGLDFEHSLAAITQLARYHALGIALRKKNPELFEEVRKAVDHFPHGQSDLKQFDDVVSNIVGEVTEDERLLKYKERLRNVIVKHNGYDAMINITLIEPWISINHGDFWVNNIMFQHDEKGNVKDIKFIDFQISRVCNPLTDLPYFICANLSIEVMDDKLDVLLDAYYAKFIDHINKLGLDSSEFTRKSFNEHMAVCVEKYLFHCIVALKIFTMKMDPDLDLNDMKDKIMLAKPSDLFRKRMYTILTKFDEKKWI